MTSGIRFLTGHFTLKSFNIHKNVITIVSPCKFLFLWRKSFVVYYGVSVAQKISLNEFLYEYLKYRNKSIHAAHYLTKQLFIKISLGILITLFVGE